MNVTLLLILHISAFILCVATGSRRWATNAYVDTRASSFLAWRLFVGWRHAAAGESARAKSRSLVHRKWRSRSAYPARWMQRPQWQSFNVMSDPWRSLHEAPTIRAPQRRVAQALRSLQTLIADWCSAFAHRTVALKLCWTPPIGRIPAGHKARPASR